MNVEPYWIDKDSEKIHNVTRFNDNGALDILYNFSSVYLIAIIALGLFLNAKAIISLVEVIKVNLALFRPNESFSYDENFFSNHHVLHKNSFYFRVAKLSTTFC